MFQKHQEKDQDRNQIQYDDKTQSNQINIQIYLNIIKFIKIYYENKNKRYFNIFYDIFKKEIRFIIKILNLTWSLSQR